MTSTKMWALGLGVIGSLCTSGATLAADAAKGQKVYEACAACHTDKADAMGPSLKGVLGRTAGTLDTFRFSNAMKRAGIQWDAANLKAYLLDPQSKVPGNKMPFGGVSAGDAEDVVAYLATLK